MTDGTALSNREIAQALFVTLRTVEMLLSNASRKLGISNADPASARVRLRHEVTRWRVGALNGKLDLRFFLRGVPIAIRDGPVRPSKPNMGWVWDRSAGDGEAV